MEKGLEKRLRYFMYIMKRESLSAGELIMTLRRRNVLFLKAYRNACEESASELDRRTSDRAYRFAFETCYDNFVNKRAHSMETITEASMDDHLNWVMFLYDTIRQAYLFVKKAFPEKTVLFGTETVRLWEILLWEILLEMYDDAERECGFDDGFDAMSLEEKNRNISGRGNGGRP